MSISYSALTNKRRVTLPSVESWGDNNNILRDPPKSIHTRKIDKVGSDSLITETIDGSEDRINECILKFAKGVNPMVSVEYGNHSSSNGHISAKLPYTIMKGGAFRPPILRQEQLQPLSRQSRNITKCSTNKQWVDFTKKLRTCGSGKNEKAIKNDVLKMSSTPTYRQRRDVGIRGVYEDLSTIRTKDTLTHSVNTVKSQTQSSGGNKIQQQLSGKYFKDAVQGVYKTETNKQIKIGKDQPEVKKIELELNRPHFDYQGTYGSKSIYGEDNWCREYRNLPQRVNRGGCEIKGFHPSTHRYDVGVSKVGILENRLKIGGGL